MTETTIGRRERKKAATRKALADAALKLFVARGFDQVGVREIAEAADVSTATLFKHFPGKEALVFDEDEAREAALVSSVRDRPEGRSVVTALREYIARGMDDRSQDPAIGQMRELIHSTPALIEYGQRLWMRHETSLAHAIAEAQGLPEDDPACAALAHFALAARFLQQRRAAPEESVDRAFDLLEHGWTALTSP
ncbi:TetR/AcrR family transcriptional regulator [Kribbella sp. NBC_01505]|uniref:TetR/AcrR family transcriptional regulator n=1 Tax=Kribbella sp. NBC_01505 TaxID=2903580 RepID=UPI0038630512